MKKITFIEIEADEYSLVFKDTGRIGYKTHEEEIRAEALASILGLKYTPATMHHCFVLYSKEDAVLLEKYFNNLCED